LVVAIRYLAGYGQEPVYARKLHGNKFSITIRNLDGAVAQQVAAYLQANQFLAFVNYYDEQRFGTPHSIHNTHLIGQHLLANEWSQAYEAYLESDNDPQETVQVAGTRAAGRSHYEALLAIMPSKLDFFISAYHSFLWNQKLNQIIARSGQTLQVELPYLGLLSFPATPALALPASLSIPVEKRNWQTGQNYPAVKDRPILINVPVHLLDTAADSHHPGRQALSLTFYLPTGCYATMLIKQLLLVSRFVQT
jgi:tRNA pseudouridine13 synthase